MNTPTFLEPVQNSLVEVEQKMRAQSIGHHPDLGAAIDLILASGGKRIRPALTMLTGHMLGAEHEQLVTMAAAIELLHTATLVHDDLIDGSLLRRGSPTLNSQWSPGATVLTGDFLFARAAELAAETNSIEVMKLFARTLTIIVNGEISQLFTQKCSLDRKIYFSRIYAKTASLFETATTSAAIISNAYSATIDAVREYGNNIGIAFQIVDDVLDFAGNQSMVGKPVGSDLHQGIITLPVIIYNECHPNDPSVQAIVNGDCPNFAEATRQLVEKIRNSEAIPYAIAEARQYVDRALAYIRQFDDCEERRALKELAEYIVNRNL